MSRFKGDDAKRLQDPGSWSEDDVAYLRDRQMLPAGYELADNLRGSAPAARPIDEIPNLGDAGILVDGDPLNPSIQDPSDPVLEDDLDDMRKGQLQIEARSRGLDDGGTVPELRQRIREFDARTP